MPPATSMPILPSSAAGAAAASLAAGGGAGARVGVAGALGMGIAPTDGVGETAAQ
jgi:hypothetical protein